MKTLRKFSILAVLAFTLFAGFSVDAANFDRDPDGGGTGFASIIDGSAGATGNANLYDSLRVNIPNPGDSQDFYVFVDFRNESSGVIRNPRAHLNFPSTGTSSTTSLDASLSGGNASTVHDGVTLTHLPSSWRIEFVNDSGSYVQIPEHRSGGQSCDQFYGIQFSYTDVRFSNPQSVVIPPDNDPSHDTQGLNYSYGNGWCQQGYVTYHMRVTNTISPNPTITPSVNTLSASSITQTSAILNGEVTSGTGLAMWFVYSTSPNPSCSQRANRVDVTGQHDAGDVVHGTVTGLQPGTRYYYHVCASDGSHTYDGGEEYFYTPSSQQNTSLSVTTLDATNIHQTSAYLNAEILSGNNLEVYFTYGSSSQAIPTCSQQVRRVTMMGHYSAGDRPSKGVAGLTPGTLYNYIACVTDGSTTVGGGIKSFTTESNNAGWHWVYTQWGDCIGGFQRREAYCADAQGNIDPQSLACNPLDRDPLIRSCSTNDLLPEANTGDVTSIDTDSARLHGEVRMNDVNDGIVFFVYGESESRIDHVSSYSSYDDVSEHGLDRQKVIVDDDDDVNDWKEYSERVSGLNGDTRYYYRICVDYYYQQAHHLECGSVEHFTTDSDGGSSSGDVVIDTLAPQSVGKTVAKLCGDLVDNGGNDSLLTWIEYRKSGSTSYHKTDKVDRDEGEFCEIVRDLTPGTTYYYRACSEEGCASERHFKTSTDTIDGAQPEITTGMAYDVRPHSAKLPATYISHANKATIYFKYGHSHLLNKRTRSYTVYGDYGQVVHPFTNLYAHQYYCYRAVIETAYGTDEGATKCFYTPSGSNGGGNVQVVTIVKDDKPDIDLEKLGLGLSLIQLDISDNLDSVTKGQQVTYTVRWKNISKLDLTDLELNVEIPREVQIMGASQGLVDRDRNSVYYTIDRLDAGESGSMSVTGMVVDGNPGDSLTASATLAFDNPVNQAQEDATDYDVDTFVVPVAGVNIGAGSLFGLGNVTFLGWLTILLGLFILFLIVRWLYLEREELRARAYANYHRGGYYPPAPTRRYEAPTYEREGGIHNVPSQREVARREDEDPGYRPYRPNR